MPKPWGKKRKSKAMAEDTQEQAKENSVEDSHVDGVEVSSADGAAPDEPEPTEVSAEMIRTLPDDELLKLAHRAAEADKWEDRAKREHAEAENRVSRIERQMQTTLRFASERLVKDLIDPIDNLKRALAAAEENKDFEPLHEGVSMTYKLVLQGLAKHGVEPIDAAGNEFDPGEHEAVMTGADDDQENNVVLDCYEQGWKLHDRTLRPAKVRVNKL